MEPGSDHVTCQKRQVFDFTTLWRQKAYGICRAVIELTPQLMTVVIIWKVNWISSGAAYSWIHTCTVEPEPWSLQPQIHCHDDKHRNISIKLGQIPDVKPISLRWAPHTRSRREKVIELAFSLPRSFICCGWKGKPSSLFRNFPSSTTLRRVMLNDCAKRGNKIWDKIENR